MRMRMVLLGVAPLPRWLATLVVLISTVGMLPVAPAVQATVHPAGIEPLTATAAAQATALGSMTWLFAEGYTGPGFDEYLVILNPETTDGVARISYFVEGQAEPETRAVTLPANSRITIPVHRPYDELTRPSDPNANPYSLGRRSVGHSTRVESTVLTVVERPIYFRYGNDITGGHILMGATAPARTWLFAEGYTGPGFDEYLTILNPNPTAGTASISYFVEGEPNPRTRSLPLAANSRTTIPVHLPYALDDAPGTHRASLGRLTVGHSTRVDTTLPVVVERPIYFRYTPAGAGRVGPITGGHTILGAPRRNPVCTVSLNGTNTVPANSSRGAASVQLTFDLATGLTRGDWLVAGLTAITNAQLHRGRVGIVGGPMADFANLPAEGGAFTTLSGIDLEKVEAMVADSSAYYLDLHTAGFPEGELRGQLDCTPPPTTWLFAEGFTGEGFDEYLTILNPNAAASTATISYFVEGERAPRTSSLGLAANSRTTVAVHTDPTTYPNGLGRLAVGHSIRVQTTLPTVIERPIYFTYTSSGGGPIKGGHNVMGSEIHPAHCLAILNPPTSPPGPAMGIVQVQLDPFQGQLTSQWLVSGLTRSISRAHLHGEGANPALLVDFGAGLPPTGGLARLTSSLSNLQAELIAANPNGTLIDLHTSDDTVAELSGRLTCAPRRGTQWLFAEGYTGNGFDEYLTIVNPASTNPQALITYLVEGEADPTVNRPPPSEPVTGVITLPSNSRQTIAVFRPRLANDSPNLGRRPRGHATALTTIVPVVIERPTYFSYQLADGPPNSPITGGHSVVGATNRAGGVCLATLRGENQLPPITSPGQATAQLTIDRESGQIDVLWQIGGLTSAITQVHIHRGSRTSNGPIVLPLVLPASANGAAISTRTTASIADALLSDPNDYYINIHTTAELGGELRGQLACIS